MRQYSTEELVINDVQMDNIHHITITDFLTGKSVHGIWANGYVFGIWMPLYKFQELLIEQLRNE